MSYNWRQPIPRTAILVVHPDTGEIVLQRDASEANTPMSDSAYRMVERERREWARVKQEDDLAEQSSREHEITVLRLRQMARESFESRADLAYEKLSSWIKYVDTDRWLELCKWLDDHPQRISPDDRQLIEVDERLITLIQGFPISPITLRPKRGSNSKGAVRSPEARARHSETMRKKWKEWKENGKAPAVGRPPSSSPPKDEVPY